MLISKLDNVPTVTCGLTKIITCMRTFETAVLQNDHKERRLVFLWASCHGLQCSEAEAGLLASTQGHFPSSCLAMMSR